MGWRAGFGMKGQFMTVDHNSNILVKCGGPTMLFAKIRSSFTNTLVPIYNVYVNRVCPCLFGGMVNLVWNECGGIQKLSKFYFQATRLGQHNHLFHLGVRNSSVIIPYTCR